MTCVYQQICKSGTRLAIAKKAIFMAIPYLLIKELFYDNLRQH